MAEAPAGWSWHGRCVKIVNGSTAFEIADLKRRGADVVVVRQHQCRKTDFRRGVQLGRYDHRVVWKKPARPDGMDEESYRPFPDELARREVRIPHQG
jgi:hypothetical protein